MNSAMQDPNLTFQLHAESRFIDKYPSLKMNLQLDTVNALALHLINDSLQMHFKLNTDFSSTNPDSLQGQGVVSDLGITIGTHIIHTDSVTLYANHSDSGQSILFRSEAADLDWTGKYKLTQVSESLKQFINHYYAIQVSKKDSTEPEQWQMNLRVRPSPLVLTLMPSLKGSDSLSGKINFNSAKREFALDLHSEKIQINDQVIHQLQVKADSRGNALGYSISVSDAGHKGFMLHHSSVYGKLENDKLLATLRLEDNKNKDRYLLSGTVSKSDHGARLVLNPDSVLLNYLRWSLPADNFIYYDSSGLLVRNLKLTSGSQSLAINSAGETTQAPLDIQFTDFKIKTISQFAEQDSLLLDGTINGKAEIKNLFTKPLFTSDIKVDTLAYEKDTLGNLVIQVNNEELNAYIAHIKLSGQDNDVQVDGKYFSGESKMDMNVKLNQLNLASFKGLASIADQRYERISERESACSGEHGPSRIEWGTAFRQCQLFP